MNILILGSEGFIGKHCVQHFLKKGDNVFGADIVDYTTANYTYHKLSRIAPGFEILFKEVQYDACINAAGNGNVQVSITAPYNDYEANCSDVLKLLECFRLYNVSCRYIHISSAAVYGNPEVLPVKESANCQPLSPYGWHKMMSEQICREYHSLYKIPVCAVRPFSVYGEGLRKQLFWDVYQRSKKNNRLQLSGTGNESRDFIHVKDLVNCFDILIAKAPMNGEVYNLASGIETKIKDVVQMFCNEIDPAIEPSFNHQTRAGDPLNWCADISAVTALGFKQTVGLKDGIKKLVEWLTNEEKHRS